MNGRRQFFCQMLVGAAAMTLDPERLLFEPGEKKIFIPPVGGWKPPFEFDIGSQEYCMYLVRYADKTWEVKREPVRRYDQIINLSQFHADRSWMPKRLLESPPMGRDRAPTTEGTIILPRGVRL